MRLSTSSASREADGATPLPTKQIIVLMLTRLAEPSEWAVKLDIVMIAETPPVSYTVIFPFINQMISETGVTDNPDKVGFYSGLVVSTRMQLYRSTPRFSVLTI